MSLYVVKCKKTSLRTPLAAADTTVKLRELVDIDDREVVTADFGEFFVLVVKQGDTIEMIKCTAVTQIGDGTANCTVATNGRSISPYTPYAGAATGEDFQTAEVIVTNDPLTMSRFASLDNANTWDEVQTFTQPPVLPTPVANTDGANKAYVDGVGSAGASDANETTKGLVEAATQTEVDEGDDTGSTTAPTAVRPSKAANAVQRGVWVAFTESASGDDAYTADTTPSFTPANKSMVYGSFATANTGGATFALNGETPVAIQKVVSGALGALETGDIIANAPLFLYRTASVWVLLSPGGTMPTTALLSEMKAILDATDITGAELEDLTDSGLTILHGHPYAGIASSRDLTAAGGAVTHAHGLGITPRWVKVTAFVPLASNFSVQSIGTWVGGTYACAWTGEYTSGSTTSAVGADTTFVVKLMNGGDAADDFQTATVSVDGTNVTLTWTKSNSPGGTARLFIECGY